MENANNIDNRFSAYARSLSVDIIPHKDGFTVECSESTSGDCVTRDYRWDDLSNYEELSRELGEYIAGWADTCREYACDEGLIEI